MNRIITYLVVGLYLFAGNPFTTEAQTLPTFSFSAENTTPNEGEDFRIDINAENFRNLVGFQFLVTFDENVIQPVVANPPNPTVMLQAVNGTLAFVNASYVPGEGLRVSWNALDGLPKTIDPLTPPSTLFKIPFTAVGSSDFASSLGIDCVNFDCEVIGQNGMTGNTETIATTIDLGGDDLIIDIGGTGSTVDTGGPLTIIATNPGGPSGSTVCMEISVENFDSLTGFQYTMHWDPTIFEFSNTQNHILPEFGTGNFNLIDDSTLGVSWSLLSGAEPVVVDDGTVIYEVCFIALGSQGDVSDFTFDGDPVTIEVTDSDNNQTNEIDFTNGTLNITEGQGANTVNFTVGTVEGDPGDNVCIPVTVSSFDDIVGFQYSMNWDPDVLSLTGTQNHNTDVDVFGPSFFNEASPGNLIVSYNHPTSTPTTLMDGVLLYEVCFDVVGNPGQTTNIEITDIPSDINIITSTGNDGILTSNDGTFTVTNEGGPSVSVCNEALENPDPNDPTQVCVPFQATGLTNVLGLQWTITYDATQLDAPTTPTDLIQFAHPDLLLLSSFFNEVEDGVIVLAWSHPTSTPQTIESGEVIFEMCFDITGNLADADPVQITNAPTSIEITALADPSDPASTTIISNITINNENCIEEAMLEASATITAATCSDSDDGAIDLTVTGGQMPYTFAWDSGQTTEDLAEVPAGTYMVTITDDSGATSTQSFDITSPDPITATLTSTNETMSQAGDGTINITTITGGTPDYTYLWSGGETTQNISGLSPDTYTVTITDTNQCTAEFSAMVGTALTIGPEGVTTGSTEVTDIDCAGARNGEIDLVFSGGVSPYTFLWDNGATTEDLTGLAPGTYCVTVTDANGTTADACFDIEEPTAISITLDEIIEPTAQGMSDGAIMVSVTGGTPRPQDAPAPYFYTWMPVGSTPTEDLENQPAGTYTLTVVDASGCSATSDPYTIEDGPAILTIDTNESLVTDVACFGDATGGINVSVLNGTMPFTFAWSPNTGDNTQNVGGLAAGTYSVTVTDANSAVAVASFEVNQPTAINITGSVTNEMTANDGAIDLTVSGGSGNKTYMWSNNMTTEDISGLAGGDYTVTVTDSNGCTETATFTITPAVEPLVINVNQSVITDASCFGGNDGAINVTIEGGLNPYSFSWSNGANTEDISGLGAGTYTLTVMDALGTTTMQSFLVGQAPEIQIVCVPIPESTNGGDGGANVTVSGGTPGYTYEWFNAAGNFISNVEDISGLTSGTYTIRVTDANDCVVEEDCTIQGIFGVSSAVVNDVDCFEDNTGSINLTTVGGTPPYSWIWTDANNMTVGTQEDLSNRTAGLYTVSISDANGNNYTETYEIIQPNTALTITNAVVTDQIAPDLGAINITVSGGTPPYTYMWSNGSTNEDLTNLVAGTFSGTIEDANGCVIVSEEYTVGYVPAALVVTGQVMTEQPDCNGDTNGSITFSFDGGDAPYTVAWTNDDSATITQSAPVSYTITELAATTYNITITDDNGQVLTREVQVTQPDAISINPIIENVTDCPGDGMINLNGAATQGGTPPYDYNWSGPSAFSATTPSVGNLEAGEYYVTVTDANDCVRFFGPLEVNIEVPALTIQLSSTSVMEVTCQDDTDGMIDLTVSGGYCQYEYLWNNAATTEDISGLGAGTYIVTVTDDAGTTATESFTIEATSDISINNVLITSDYNGFAVSSPIACDGTASVSVNSSNGISILWCNGQTGPNATGLCEGECEVVVTDNFGCTQSAIVELDADIPSGLTVTEEVEVACSDDCDGAIALGIFGGSDDYTIVWSDATLGNTSFIDNLCPGTYAYTVSDAAGTVVMNSVDVGASTLALTFDITQPTGPNTFDGMVSVSVSGGSGDYSYQWNDNNMTITPRVQNLDAGNYWVIVTDNNTGCQITDNIRLDDNLADCFSARNIITPNEDGLNDNFVIACLEDFVTNTLEIYNRWGQLVMEYEDYDNEWIGQNRRNQDLPAGAYFYVLVGTYQDGTQEQFQGHITVLREE